MDFVACVVVAIFAFDPEFIGRRFARIAAAYRKALSETEGRQP